MKRNSLTGIGLAAALLLSGPTSSGAQGERYQLSGDIVAVYNLVGDVTVEASDGSAVEVTVTSRGAHGDRLTVATGSIDGRETLRVIYPADEIRHGNRDWGNSQLRIRSDGTFGGGESGQRVKISRTDGDLEAWAVIRLGGGSTLSFRRAELIDDLSQGSGVPADAWLLEW